MSRRTLYRCVMLSSQAGDPLRLEYYLLTDDAHFDGGYLEVYGVEILLYRPGVRKPERRDAGLPEGGHGFHPRRHIISLDIFGFLCYNIKNIAVHIPFCAKRRTPP